MSATDSSGSNGTIIVTGPDVIQTSDFYVSAGILHPIIIGSIAIITLFTFLRLGSNRSIAPITTFDWLINVALGSTLAGIVNGNSLVRGLLALATMLGFQFLTSMLSTRLGGRIGRMLQSRPLVVAFRGKMLSKVMMKHRISEGDINASLRQNGILNIELVECAIIEPNGAITIFTIKQLDEAMVEPDVLMAVPAYKALCENDEEKAERRGRGKEERSENGQKGVPCKAKDRADEDMDLAANDNS